MSYTAAISPACNNSSHTASGETASTSGPIDGPPAGHAVALEWPITPRLLGSEAETAAARFVADDDAQGGKVLELQTVHAPTDDAHIYLRLPTAEPVRGGDVMLATFSIRCIWSMCGDALLTFVFGRGADTDVAYRVGTDVAWTRIQIPFVVGGDAPAGSAQVQLRCGYEKQTVQVRDLELVNHGPDADVTTLPFTRVDYVGREANASWRDEALRRIEVLRKGDVVVRVADADGKPIAGATVHARLAKHRFGFGSAVTAEHLTADTDDARQYRAIVERLFSHAVFENDMKWQALWDGIPTNLDPAMRWLTDRHFSVRGHCLVWPSWRWLPNGLRQWENDPAALRRHALEHIRRTVTHFRGRLGQWDVVNEPYSNYDLFEHLGRGEMVEWFRAAHEADPDCQLFLNDFGILEGALAGTEHRDHYYDTLKFLVDSGTPLGGVGIQSHFSARLPAPTQVLSIFDRFAEFGLPIESTELSLSLDDRGLQADYLRDYLIAAFSHPALQGVMLWGFWEGQHWRPRAALFDRDWTPRPQVAAWEEMVLGTWQTDVTLTTDREGRAAFRGFFGQYDLTACHAGQSERQLFTHTGNGTNAVVTF